MSSCLFSLKAISTEVTPQQQTYFNNLQKKILCPAWRARKKSSEM